MGTELKKITILNKELIITKIFAPNGLDKIIEDIKEKARSVVQDMTTKQGRDAIKSMAHKIAKMKVSLDNAGKSLVEEKTKEVNLVNISRKQARDELDALKNEIRKPLTDWENREEKRVENLNLRIKQIEDYKNIRDIPSIDILRKIKELKEELKVIEWEEFKTKAETIIKETLEYLQSEYEKTLKQEDEKEELEKLRKKQAEQDKKDHEEKIRLEAKKKAEREAKEKAIEEKKRVDEEKKQAKIKAKEKQDKIKREKEETEIKLKEQKRLRIEAEIQAKNNIEQAKIQAEKDKQEAIEKERERVKIENKKIEEEAKKREANVEHHKKINNEAMEDLIKIISQGGNEIAKNIVIAIAKGKIRNLSIKY